MCIFSELYEFNEKLTLNLKFERKPIDDVAKSFNYIPKILSGERVLDGNDGEFISDYFSNLGKTDALSQIDYLNGRKTALEKYKNESFDVYKKYSSLYVKIFFLIGVLMAVLLA